MSQVRSHFPKAKFQRVSEKRKKNRWTTTLLTKLYSKLHLVKPDFSVLGFQSGVLVKFPIYLWEQNMIWKYKSS